MERALPIVLAALSLLTACGPTGLREAETAHMLRLGPENTRRIETLTDLEEARDVAVVGDTMYVATDMGLLRFASNGEAAGQLVPGLPSEDVRALVEDEGALLVATAGGMARIAGEELTRIDGAPDVGHVTDLARTTDGTLWLCGLGGLARRTASGWEAFGEPVRCTTMAATPEGQLWVGTSAGLLFIEGDVIREHPISGGIPEGYVRAVVPVLPGKILAILQGPSSAQIGYWDGERWYGYTLRGMSGPLVGLVRRGPDVLLVGSQRVIAIAPTGAGVPLVTLSSNEGTVRSFRARLTPAAQHQAAPSPGAEALQEPKPLAAVPENQPTRQAPPFVARALEVELDGRAYASFAQGADAFLAISNGGVMRLSDSGPQRTLRSLSLVPEESLQLATDSSRTVWMLSRSRQLAKYVGGRLRRSALPTGIDAQALAPGPQGAYLLALEPSAGPNAVRIYQNTGTGWQPLAQRTLTLPTRLTGVPFIGVAPDGKIWAALRVLRDEGTGDRLRGLAVIDPRSEAVVFHHRGAERPGLPVPDEVSTIDFDTDGNAWISSLSGLVRVDSHQAVVFGESRGVRGEVVSDAAVGNAVIWIASAEGVASYDRTRFDYAHPAFVHQARPTRLATDRAGHLWAASSRGLVVRDASEWLLLGADEGLPTSELVDVEIDGAERVWLLASDRMLMISR